jgi:hypothetical protein
VQSEECVLCEEEDTCASYEDCVLCRVRSVFYVRRRIHVRHMRIVSCAE